MKYNELSTKDRANIILMHYKAGFRKLSDIEDNYNRFAEGGLKTTLPVKKPVTIPTASNNYSMIPGKTLPVANVKKPVISMMEPADILIESPKLEIPKQINESTRVDVSQTFLQDNPSLSKYKEKKSTIRKEEYLNPRAKIEDKPLLNDIISSLKEEQESKAPDKVIDKFYNKFDSSNRDEVIKIQTELKKKGYDLGKSGIDGKFGNKTKAAYEKEYPKVAPVETSNLSAKILDNIATQSKNSKYSNEQCATFVSDVYDYNVLGNAWEMKANIEKNLGTIKYNIYDDKRFENVKNADELKSLTKKIKQTNKASADMFDVGDVVGIYWDSSSYHETARKDGKGGTKNTHVGFVSSIKDGVPIITHNIHGKLVHSKYNTITVGWIGAPKVTNVEYGNSSKETDTASLIKHYGTKMTKESKLNIDAQQVQDDIYGILKVETNLGAKTPSELDVKSSKIKRQVLGKNYDDEAISQGIGKIKINSFTKQEQSFLGLNNKTINDNQTSVKAATYLYLKNYKKFEEYSKKNPHLGITPDDLRVMTILSYNQGTDKLLKLGYNNSNMTFKEELESLRKLSTDEKVNDISSTKYQYLPDVIGQPLYEAKYKGGHKSYPSRVLEYGKKNRGNSVDIALK